MNRHLILGADWPLPLIDDLVRILSGWRVTRWADASAEDIRAAAVIVPTHVRVDRALVEGGAVRLIHQFGVGVDNVDLPAMKALGVAVSNAPSEMSGMAASVAEGAVLLVLSCARLPSLRADNLAKGAWNWTMPLNFGLARRRVGLVGLGSIGKAIARRLVAFDMKVTAVRRSKGAPDEAEAMGLDWIGARDRLDELVETSDMVVICAPLNEATRGLFGAELIGRMKPSASLINVGRGGIVDEAALLAALDAGRLHAAGLDTISAEPPAPDSPLSAHRRIVLTPHDAGVTDKAFEGVAHVIRENLRRLEAGEPLLNRIV
ncbi:NAD(P)-dependent oxidoreductase [Aurantimonas sp. C2-6-R+9]|uniref:NAD(P)-dependent oxidoreductase n=1 Tax=unclassified Aurantimonas TaxID=2638230 RepID=UPI002E171412|nr:MULTISPECIES: NAD(P)-dependent oxidoreductase [unclassified Aurantimonas]MEC5293246.1 NAD(P)-dependent oxidoreductase [Aurantimonas sp. C2-3-R2]MEC5383386.1 NAD(P)-dependent oxidoreductase [Aurantimonas sp. C2-6-R+9]MEC5414340.1 NAD(P)-dependent oxidoreductase [Aurantimonas sp. C2-4-R8]